MIRQTWAWIGVLISLLSLLTGCWDQRGIAQRAIVVAVGLSAHHEWTFVFPNVTTTVSSLTSVKSSQEFYALTTHAPTFPEARARIQREASRQLSLGDLELLLVSAQLSTHAVANLINTLNLSGTIPASLWVAATNVPPRTLLLQSSPQSVVPTFPIVGYFACHGCHAAPLGIREWQWWDREGTPGISPTLPLVVASATGPSVRQVLVYPPQGTPQLMPRTVTQGFAYLMERVLKGSIPVAVHGVPYTVARIHDKVHTHLALEPDAVVATIHVTVWGNLATPSPQGTVTRSLELSVGNAMAHTVLQRCLLALAWARQTRTDPFGYAKTAAWLHSAAARTIPPTRLTTLPIRATVQVRGIIQGEGVAE